MKDLKWKIKKRFWNYLLAKRTEFAFIPFDVSDSVVEYTFQQVKWFYESYPERLEDTNLDDIVDDEMKETMHKQNEDKKILRNVYQYITVSRKANEELLDKLTELVHKDSVIKWIDCTDEKLKEKGCVEMLSEGEKYFKFTYYIDDNGLINVTDQTPCERKYHNLWDIDSAIYQLETDMCAKIIFVRHMLWD